MCVIFLECVGEKGREREVMIVRDLVRVCRYDSSVILISSYPNVIAHIYR